MKLASNLISPVQFHLHTAFHSGTHADRASSQAQI